MADTLTFTSGLPAKRIAAGVLFEGPVGRHLLVEPTYKQYWDLPGGLVERNESPAAAAAREVKEELGLVVRVGNLLVVDWFAPVPGVVTEAIMFVFDGGFLPPAIADQIQIQGDELRSWAWSTRAEMDERLANAPKLRARVLAAIAARDLGFTSYLDAGEAVRRG